MDTITYICTEVFNLINTVRPYEERVAIVSIATLVGGRNRICPRQITENERSAAVDRTTKVVRPGNAFSLRSKIQYPYHTFKIYFKRAI